MKKVTLTRGKVAIVDDEDYNFVSQWKWSANKIGEVWYASRNNRMPDPRGTVYLHRSIADRAGIDCSALIDHRDRNGLDCQRRNLRAATKSENTTNSRRRKDNLSGMKGVGRHHSGKWRARIKILGKEVHLGLFTSKLAAGRAYDTGALIHFGEFAKTNFPRSLYATS